MEGDLERQRWYNSKAAYTGQDASAPAVIASKSRRVPLLIMLWNNRKAASPGQDASAPAVIPSKCRRVPLLITLIIVANVTMFLVSMFINNCPHNTANGKCFPQFLGRLSFQPLSENPFLGPSAATLQRLGALDINKVVQAHQGWRLITCIWLHAGVIHILINMLSLLSIGIKLEQKFGFWRIGILYLLSGFGGSLLSALFSRNGISVGAFGAVFGLLGAMLSELITNWSIHSNKCAGFTSLLVMVVINLAFGLLPFVDNFANIGGLVSGFLAGFVLLVQPQAGWISQGNEQHGYVSESPVKHKHNVYQYIFLVVALVILIAGFSVVLVLVLRGVDGNKKCS